MEVVFDEFREAMEDAGGAEPQDSLVQLIDPLNPRFVMLEELDGVATQLDPETGFQVITGSGDGLESLPVSIRQRLRYDPINQRLIFSGVFDDTIAGDPLLLLNIMSFREANILKTMDGSEPDADEDMTKACDSLDDECSWSEAIEALLRLTRNPNGINRICVQDGIDSNTGERICTLDRAVERGELLVAFEDPVVEAEDYEEGDPNQGLIEPFKAEGVQPALTAGAAQSVGWVTVAFNNDPQLDPAPVSLSIMRVDCLRNPPPPDPAEILSTYQGQLNVIAPDNIFDEQLTLRHSGDFGGDPDALQFEWYFQPDLSGLPPEELPDPDSGQLNGWFKIPVDDDGQGINEVVIEGANIQTLSDNWYLARYKGLPVCENQNEWSLWAGQPGATPTDQRAQLGQGWVTRVLGRLNPFEARVQDFHSSPTNTYSSMLVQLGERYEGDIPLTSNPEVLNSIGLIEAYTTVMRRAMDLSVNAVPPVDYGPVNNAILNVSTRILDFYALLGNEAYADAQDPTIGLLTSGEFESFAPTIFPFQNQTASLLEEELILLRGRDDSQGPIAANPVYNRFFWNFTTGDGEVAYALNYGITDQNTDGVIDEFDARIQYPQGHGDAWGHYLTGLKTHYDLLRHPFFTWNPRADAVPVAGVPLQVDFFDERKFAQVAAAKARTGAEIVDLTYRRFYVEDPLGQWQGYKDDDAERAWGLSEWARRAGQGAFFDWVIGNAICPKRIPTRVTAAFSASSAERSKSSTRSLPNSTASRASSTRPIAGSTRWAWHATWCRSTSTPRRSIPVTPRSRTRPTSSRFSRAPRRRSTTQSRPGTSQTSSTGCCVSTRTRPMTSPPTRRRPNATSRIASSRYSAIPTPTISARAAFIRPITTGPISTTTCISMYSSLPVRIPTYWKGSMSRASWKSTASRPSSAPCPAA